MAELPRDAKLQVVSSATFLTAKVRVYCQHLDMTSSGLPSNSCWCYRWLYETSQCVQRQRL
jgi:hypothetical protein